MQCKQMNNFRRRLLKIENTPVLYSLTHCLGLHSRMCATQMSTSGNPELWDIQLSSWLFCELTQQLCPWMASFCYFFASHMMHAGNILEASAVRLRVTKPRTSDQRLCRLPTGDRKCMWVCITTHTISIASASDHSLTGKERFTIAAFASIGCHCFPHEETQDWTTHTAWQSVYTMVIAAYDSSMNQSL